MIIESILYKVMIITYLYLQTLVHLLLFTFSLERLILPVIAIVVNNNECYCTSSICYIDISQSSQ